MCKFTDDTMIHASDYSLSFLICKLEHHGSTMVENGFENDFMKLNQGKCHLVISRYIQENV